MNEPELSAYREAIAYCEADRPDLAVEVLEQFVDSTEDLELLVLAAASALECGDLDLSVRCADLANTAFPGFSMPWRIRALAEIRLGNFAGADRASANAVEIDRDDFANHLVRGIVMLYSGRMVDQAVADMAATSARNAIRLEPDEPYGYLLLGDVALALERDRPARKAYRAALQREPHNYAAIENLARMDLTLWRHSRSIGRYLDLYTRDPSSIKAGEGVRAAISGILGASTRYLLIALLLVTATVSYRGDFPEYVIFNVSVTATVTLALALRLGVFRYSAGPELTPFLIDLLKMNRLMTTHGAMVMLTLVSLWFASTVDRPQASIIVVVAFGLVIASLVIGLLNPSHRKRTETD